MDTEKFHKIGIAFSPSAPISSEEFFLGRLEHVDRTCDAINERGQHFVLYGERGVGKTSLANILNSKLRNVVVSKVTCNRNDNFEQVWKKALANVRFETSEQGAGFVPHTQTRQMQLDHYLPGGESVDSIAIQSVLQQVERNLLFVFDEFDSVSDDDFRANFADTIKNLSDNASNVTVGIVGVAESVNELIGSHPSIERCLRQIELPRMSHEELRQIVAKGLTMVGIEIVEDAMNRVLRLSSGFPHYIHLLMKYAAKYCVEADSDEITTEHLQRAIDDAIENANQSIRDGYRRATIVAKTKSKFEDVIAACALAEEDEFGTFAMKDIVEPYYRVTGERVKSQNLTYNIGKLCQPERGDLLSKVGESKNVRYVFRNPLMKVFIMLKLAQRGSYEQPELSFD